LDFSYNPAGQITSRTDSNTSYAWTDFVNFTENSTHNGLNQILSVTGQSIAPDYDDRGNLIGDHNNQTYDYDEYNRLTDVGSTIDLAYDPFGRLAETSGTGVTFREFMYDGINLIAEYNGSGTLQRRYVHGPGTDEPLVEYTSSSTSSRTWLMADERGSIVAITNGSGNATQINTYDEYGDPGSSNAGRFGYTGQMWLPETGLYHYKARAYNPELGRFMQTDPIGVNGGMNIYAYVGGDPVNLVDPLGLDDEDGHDDWTGTCDFIIQTGDNLVCYTIVPIAYVNEGFAGGLPVGVQDIGSTSNQSSESPFDCYDFSIEFSLGSQVGATIGNPALKVGALLDLGTYRHDVVSGETVWTDGISGSAEFVGMANGGTHSFGRTAPAEAPSDALDFVRRALEPAVEQTMYSGPTALAPPSPTSGQPWVNNIDNDPTITLSLSVIVGASISLANRCEQ
jgi:RHS repeat-associated protein